MLRRYYGDYIKFIGAVGAMASTAVALNKHYSEEAVSTLQKEFNTKLDAIEKKLDASLDAIDKKLDASLVVGQASLNVVEASAIAAKDVIVLKSDVMVMNAELVQIKNKLDSLLSIKSA